MPNDPFRHYPELQAHIRPLAQNFFRNTEMAEIDRRMAEAGLPDDWRTPDAEREADRRAFLADHQGDLWVFAYGSLMWDPGLDFAELRRGEIQGYRRSFCLWDDGGRGSPEAPGLMAALDTTDSPAPCQGLVFRLAPDKVEPESFQLFRREMIAKAYGPRWVEVTTAQGPLTAVTFVADHANETIVPDIALDEQARMIAHAEGILGPSFAYLDDLKTHLDLLEINDPYVTDLHRRATALRG